MPCDFRLYVISTNAPYCHWIYRGNQHTRERRLNGTKTVAVEHKTLSDGCKRYFEYFQGSDVDIDMHWLPTEWNHPVRMTVLPHSWWKSMPISEKPCDNIKKTYRDPLTDFMVDDYIGVGQVNLHLLWPWQPFHASAYFPDCLKICVLHLCWIQPAESGHCMQISISNQMGNHTKQYPVNNYWKYS